MLEVLGGLPQGSCLVILFLIYINDLLKLKLHGALQLFCDDAALSNGAQTFETLKNQMSEDLQTIVTFLSSRNF